MFSTVMAVAAVLGAAVTGVFSVGFIFWAFAQECINREMQEAKAVTAMAMLLGTIMFVGALII